MINFGGVIKKYREERKLKQTDLAKSIGITSTYISAIENNRKEPSISLLTSISKELDIPAEIFFWDAIQISDKIASKDRKIIILAKKIVKEYFSSKKDL